MTLENRGRLVRAIVERVEVDERSGQVIAELVDLDLGDETRALTLPRAPERTPTTEMTEATA